MGKLDGKVALVTGAARGQGRSHALRLAGEGADVIGIDICADIPTVQYPMGTLDDLRQTEEGIEALGRRASVQVADVRDEAALLAAVQAGIDELGPLDIVVANAGIAALALEQDPKVWDDTIGVNLSGVFYTVEAAIPSMTAHGRGGSIVLISSTGGLNGVGGTTRAGLAYGAAKHGVIGLMRSYANNLAKDNIRVNAIAPTGVNTPMVTNEPFQEFVASGVLGDNLTNALPVEVIEPIDTSNAIAWLVSDEARYVTGIVLPVDAGFTNKR